MMNNAQQLKDINTPSATARNLTMGTPLAELASSAPTIWDWTEKGEDWVAQAFTVGKQRWVAVSFYIAHNNRDSNKKIFDSMKHLIYYKCGNQDHIVLGGDANAHLEQLGGDKNHRGRLLEEFAIECGLTILNTTDKCKGRFTREKSAIDYILVNNRALSMVLGMHIDEMQEITAISDHNLLSLCCKCPTSRPRQPARTVARVNTRAAAEQIGSQLERHNATGHVYYENLRCAVKRGLRRHCQSVRITEKPMVYSIELSGLERARKQKNKQWRLARRTEGARQ